MTELALKRIFLPNLVTKQCGFYYVEVAVCHKQTSLIFMILFMILLKLTHFVSLISDLLRS